MAEGYPKAWMPLYNGHDQVVIDGEVQPMIDPNADYVMVVFQPGGFCFLAKESHGLAGRVPGSRNEQHMVQLEEKGLMANVPREAWPTWLPAKIQATIGSGAKLGPS